LLERSGVAVDNVANMATKQRSGSKTFRPEEIVETHYLAEWIEYLSDDLDQAEIARRRGVTRATISRYASGERQVSLRELRRLAAAMGLRPDALLYSPTDMSAPARVSRMNPDVLQQMLKRELGG